ncbi:DUF3991 domain-containing protein [Heyndrickxia camelliae]|uniref:DUF3991 domain-containing protein n=1 Tax=Heyndrickxia camelliae TaxID=1707093 RepID=A0A2N3LEJ6_9BACI|nr:DUF3991 domain-containing protein [Heyndrickxia camelliae]PKR83041.1 hypothetical protein CWO92_21120 [Heyndrickxia camelliae]
MYVDEDKVKIANNVSIVDYLQSIGEPLKSEGNGYYRHRDHDSLVVNDRKNFFSWNSQGVSGNAVTYLMNMYDMTFQNAVLKINEDIGQYKINKHERKEPVYPLTFDYKVKEVKTTENIRHYLIKDRKIDEEIVNQLIQADYIVEDIYKNVVFKWKEKGEIIGANLQGTVIIPEEKRIRPDRPYFKHVLPTTKEATFNGFNISKGYPENLYFFESPIDLLSYLSLKRHELRNCKLISMDGLKQQTVLATIKRVREELKEYNRDISSIKLCVDNDAAGLDFIKKMESYQYKRIDKNLVDIKTDIPYLPKGEVKWDWNNELKSIRSFKKKHESELSCKMLG